MANDFGNLLSRMPAALDTVLKRQIGFIPSVWINSSVAQAALNQTIQYPMMPEVEVVDAAANCCELPCGTDVDFTTREMTITNDKAVRFCFTGEDERNINNSAYAQGGMGNIKGMTAEQAVTELVDLVENSIAAIAYKAAHVYSPVSTSGLFFDPANNIKDAVYLRRDFNRYMVPSTDRHLVMGFESAGNMLNLPNLSRTNEAGTDRQLREGELLNLAGISMHESAAADDLIGAGATGTGYLVNGAALAGALTVTVDTGTGTIPAGTRVKFGAATDVYTVKSFAANVITLNQALKANVADNAAVVITAVGTRAELAFHRRSIVLATRLPSMPADGDAALNRATVTDPRTGISLQVTQYGGYRSAVYEIGLVWGVEMVKPEMAILIA